MAGGRFRKQSSRGLVLGVILTLFTSVLPAQARPQGAEQLPTAAGPQVRTSLRNNTSAPLRDIAARIAAEPKAADAAEVLPSHKLPKAKAGGAGGGSATGSDSPSAPIAAGMPAFDNDFEGLGNDAFVLPPDTDGDVGPDHYMQWVNLQFGIWDKDGNVLVDSTPGNALFEGLGGDCESHNDGDPITLYDHLSDRWLASQFALFGSDGSHHQCIAISTTGDPTGSWHQYDFAISDTKLNDYPKFGVWPDAYYMTVNQFDENTFAWGGQAAVAFERDQMLDGLPADMVLFDLFAVDPLFGGQLPSDLDGAAPPEGAPNLFMEVDDDSFGFDTDRLSVWEFHVDWDTPENSTYGDASNLPNYFLDVDPFEADLCGFARSCIPQPDTAQGLDAISDRLMWRLQYRNFGTHESWTVNHTVDEDGSDHAGIRWYELRDDGSGVGIHQQGTYAPDSDHRWMGSAAMDVSGNIAVGYSVSSETTFPSIRATGRLVSDPLGDLTQGESEMIAGTGSQTHPAARWGDYSKLSVDPVDQCTFWYTTEYLTTTSPADWQTRIGHFKFPSCSLGPTGTITGTVTDAATALPIEGATVTAGDVSTTTAADGTYTFILPVGTYDMTATAYGYDTDTATGVVVTDGGTVTQDFELNALPVVDVSGTVTDGSGHGWPLYARIDIDGYPGGPVFTDPETGDYSVQLVQSTDFTFHVNAMSNGYLEATRDVNFSTATATEDFALEVDATTCEAPGYDFIVDGLFERFLTEDTPDGWTITDDAGAGVVWRFDDPGGRGNLTGGTGNFAIVDSDNGGTVPVDSTLTTPVIDLTTVDSPIVRFNTDYFNLGDTADVDLSIDGGATWENIWQQEEDLRGPALEEIAIPQAANDADVQVRFHYYNAFFAWWWQVDNVLVGGEPDCAALEGGLLIGNVYDELTGEALNDATVTSDDEPADTTTTGPTPDDPALDDGYYTLFSSLTGTHDFTASKANYSSDTQSVDVVADDVVRQDFSLGAGHLVVTPDSLEVTVPMGGTTTESLVIHNDGTADATFEIGERDRGFEILKHDGARLTRRSGTFSPYAFNLAPKAARTPDIERPIPPPRALPWLDVADYPTSIMDSTADAFDGLVYSVGGFDGGGNVSDGYVYDPGTDSWSSIASMSEVREKPAAAFVDGLLYVVGGWDDGGTPSDVLEIYDPSSDSWTTGASVPTAYAAAVAVANAGLLYVIGGCGPASCGSTDVFTYDPSADSWSSAAPYPEDVSWTHCATIDGLIYCAGGVSDSGGELGGTYVYDPGADAWTALAPMPQTQWAGGYVGAGGLLLVSGGVTDNFSTVTNEGFAYDPASDTWSEIPNSNNVVYRGASACGFYKIGGSTGGFSPTPATELLPDITDCAAAADVTWLSEDPTTGTVPAGGSVEVTVTFDASVPEVPQPGEYLADLTFKEDTPYSVPPVPVTMNVTPPANWGKLDGTITGLSRCDAPGGPLANASVHVDGVNADFDLTTDENGYYEWWMPANNDPLILTVSKDGWVSKTRAGIGITPGNTTTANFTLRLDAPCAETSPDVLNFTLLQNDTATRNLLLQNVGGARGYSFVIEETEFGLRPLAPVSAAGNLGYSAPASSNGPLSVRSLTPGNAPSAPAPAAPPWFGANDIPGGLVRFGHTQCDGDENTFYIVGGVDGSFNVSDSLWRFDAGTTEWTELSPIPEGGEGPTATCDAGRIHVLGGDGTDRHYVYDIGSDSWSTAAPLPRPAWGAASATWNGQVYLIGGDSDFFFGGTSNEVNIYDAASDTWVGTGSEMPFAAVTPGFYQAGQYLYVAGGWGDDFPTNVAATQRYDLTSDTWQTGPDLAAPRADLALAATDTALYAIAGDEDGNGPFDGTRIVERLDLADWSGGGWTMIDQIGVPLTANNGGFCSTATFDPGTEVWSAGGLDSTSGSIQGRMFFRQAAEEACATIRSDVPWLSTNPDHGFVARDATKTVKVTVDASDLAVGEYHATLLIATTDPAHPEMRVRVNVTVEARPILAYISLLAGTTIDGLNVRDEDVVIVHDDGSVEMYFDGGDLGMNGLAIDAFAHSNNGSLVMSFTQPAGIPGIIGTVDDSDLVRFIPSSLGTVTNGTFVRYFDGSDVGLTTDDEDIDGVDIRPNGSILISTVGAASVPGVASADDSDLLRFSPTQLGTNTAGTWTLNFDGSDVGLTTDSEDIDAVATGASYHLSSRGPLAVPGLTAADEDVATFLPTQLGTTTDGTWDSELLLDGSTIGLGGNDVTAVEIANLP